MGQDETLRLSLDEARGLALAAQGLLDAPVGAPGLEDLRAVVERLGVLQVDTISVVARTQYLVLWSRLGAYDARLLDVLLYPHRHVFEYWSHVASIVPMADYVYYRLRMLRAVEHMWGGDQAWLAHNAEALRQTLETVRMRGPLASADFERPGDSRRPEAWDWYGVKDSRRALQLLWLQGHLMVHSRRAGQKVFDLRERVLAEAFGDQVPRDDALPSPEECLQHFVGRTVRALGVVAPGWLWDYFRLSPVDGYSGAKRTAATAALDAGVRAGLVVPATIEGLREPVYVARERLADLERLRAGEVPERTTLLSPFDSLIWDRARTRALFGYEVLFEAYVLPAKRRFGYYCLTILHRGRLVGRLDPKFERTERRLSVRAAYLEPGVPLDDALLDGLAGALADLARFLSAERVEVERSEPAELAPALAVRLRARMGGRRPRRRIAQEGDGKARARTGVVARGSIATGRRAEGQR
jgi:uncharacterized protein YcaQ